jgi:hypothetical protein
MVSTWKRLFSSIHRGFVKENTFSIAALVPGMAKGIPKWVICF